MKKAAKRMNDDDLLLDGIEKAMKSGRSFQFLYEMYITFSNGLRQIDKRVFNASQGVTVNYDGEPWRIMYLSFEAGHRLLESVAPIIEGLPDGKRQILTCHEIIQMIEEQACNNDEKTV